MDTNKNSALEGASAKPQITEADVAKQQRIVDYIKEKGGDTSKIAPLVTDSQVVGIIDDTKKLLDRFAWKLKKHYPADFKEFVKRLAEVSTWLPEHTHSNRSIIEELSKLQIEIEKHPASKDVAAIQNDREAMLKIFGTTHVICSYGGKTVIRREDHNDWIFPKELTAFYSHMDVQNDDGKPQNIVQAFMDWPLARRYGDVVFDPRKPGHFEDGPEASRRYNLFEGWMDEPEPGDDDGPWWEILQAACGYNPDYFDYCRKWFADIFQNPARKPGTAIGISGAQGVGKSALVETIGMLMSTIHRNNGGKPIRGAFGDFTLDELLDNYNEHIAHKLLVYLDEATWGGSHKEAQQLKKVITKAYDVINPKFIGRIQFDCFRREVFSSNNAFYYRPDKDDRRLLPLEFDASQIHDKSYAFWADFYEKRDNGKMLSNLLHNLLQVDLTGWHPQAALKQLRITTGGEMLASTLEPYEHWLEKVAETGAIAVEDTDAEGRKFESLMVIENSKQIADDNLENAVLLWARKHRLSVDWGSDKFKKARVKMFGERFRKMEGGVKFFVRKDIPSCEEMLKRLYSDRRWQTDQTIRDDDGSTPVRNDDQSDGLIEMS